MLIGYIGNFRFPHCTETHLSKTLRSLGCDVVQFQEDVTTAEEILAALKLAHFDLLMWSRTWGLRERGGDRIIAEAPCPTAAFSLDLYIGLDRESWISQHPWWRSSFVFTADGGHPDEWRKRGINHYWLPAAVFDQEAYIAEPSDRWRSDLCFVGSTRGYHKEWPYRAELNGWLKKTYGTRFLKTGWPLVTVRDHDLNQLYATTKIAIGDSLCPGFSLENYWSDRVYETIGRGGFIIHPYIKGMEKHFSDGEHLRFYPFGDWTELKRLIDYYLEHEDERDKIRRQGHEHVKRNHTYKHRMVEMLSTIFPGRDLQLVDAPEVNQCHCLRR